MENRQELGETTPPQRLKFTPCIPRAAWEQHAAPETRLFANPAEFSGSDFRGKARRENANRLVTSETPGKAKDSREQVPPEFSPRRRDFPNSFPTNGNGNRAA